MARSSDIAQRWASVEGAARRAGLYACARKNTLVEVIRGDAGSQGSQPARVCRDPSSPTGATAIIKLRSGGFDFLPFGKRSNPKAWAVPRRRRSR